MIHHQVKGIVAMKKKTAIEKSTAAATSVAGGLEPLIAEVRSLIRSARYAAASTVNTLQVLTNFEIGRRIVKQEQNGAKRAEYGDMIMRTLGERLTTEFGRGFSKRNLDYMRRFYLDYADRLPRIVQKPSAQLKEPEIRQKASEELVPATTPAKSSRKSPFTLSWSHYVLLLTVKDPAERSFYEIEAAREGWYLPELKRQKASCLYELLRPPCEAARGKSNHRHPSLQKEEGRHRRVDSSCKCEHPRQRVSALPAFQGTSAAKTHRLDS